MRVLDLFSGIGGFSLGLERAGMETVAFCEIEEFPRKVLKKHWPEIPIYDDIKRLTAERLRADGIGSIDLVCGGFPCQPFSTAGKQEGFSDDRDLWPEMFRVIQEVRPRWVVGENVAGFINMGIERTLSDLEGEGYQSQAFIIPACAVNAPHRRDRAWIVAYLECVRSPRPGEHKPPLHKTENRYREASGLVNAFREGALPYVCRRHNGLSDGVDRLKGLGNAVVPQIPEIIGRAIMEIEKNDSLP